MANSTVNEIKVASSAITGKLFWGPAGTVLPTDSTTALAGGFINLGHINQDGVAPAREVSVEPVKNDNGQTLLDIQNDFSLAFTATLYQTANEAVNNMIFGDANVTAGAAGPATGATLAVIDKGLQSDKGVMVIEGQTSSLGRIRRVLPVAQVSSMSEGPWVGTAVQQYEVTWSTSPDASGNYSYTYQTDGVFVP